MSIENSSTYFHDLMEGVNKQILPPPNPFHGITAKHFVIGGVLLILVFGIGYYSGKQQGIRFIQMEFDQKKPKDPNKESDGLA